MNLHPLFVHFPIALFTLYSLLEMVSFLFFKHKENLIPIKAFLAIAGVLMAIPTLYFGGVAESMLSEGSVSADIVKIHEPFALMTVLIFSIIALAYALRLSHGSAFYVWVTQRGVFFARIYDLKHAIAYHMTENWFAPVMAFIGFCTVFITGALGAAISRGPDADFIVSFVYNLFF